METDFVLFEGEYSNLVAVKPGQPYRLLPFGTMVKNGKKRVITKEYASQFALPHWKPAIKLGSHDARTPSGGNIVGLEVRDDGLYAITELTEQGEAAWGRGDYRYHSPEIVWDNGVVEDPTTGGKNNGPLIVGDALLHNPHLGEAAALYMVETNSNKEVENMDETEKTFIERLTAVFDKFLKHEEQTPVAQPDPVPAAPVVELDQFEALKKERDEYAAKLQAIEDEKAKAARVDSFAAALKETRVAEGAEMLASMSDQQAEWVLTQFKALSAKVDTTVLYSEKGSDGEGAKEPAQMLDAAVHSKMEEKKIDYNAAMSIVRAEQPDLIAAVYPVKKGG